MKRYFLFSTLIFLGWSAFGQQPVEWVNPFIGSDNYGTTNPGAIVPRGMISAVPFNVAGRPNKHEKDSDWWSTPYSNVNETFVGYSHVNLSGVGCPDLGTLILMPTTGALHTSVGAYATSYSAETASPGYYSNFLNRYQVHTEVTSSVRSAINRYTFPAGRANVLLNLGLGLTNEQDAYLRVVSNSEVEGFRTVGSFCYNNPEEIYPVYFVIRLNLPAHEFGTWKKPPLYKGVEGNWMAYNGQTRLMKGYTKPLVGDSIGAWFSYHFAEATSVEVQVGISYVSISNARENLDKELVAKDFEQVRAEAEASWNRALSAVKVEGGTSDQKTIFYTALYHTLIHPNTLNDVNGEYPQVGSGKVGHTGHTRYTVFSLWDTYRNMHQLTSLVYPGQQLGMVRSMLEMYRENGWLPKWELNSTETFTMVGDPASIVIADTYLRGIQSFDADLAMEAMLKSALQEESNPLRPELKEYLKHQYIPVQKEFDGSVSTTLEYGAADFAISQLATALGNELVHKQFLARSKYYQNMYDRSEGVMRPRLSNGTWYAPFSPLDGANFQPVTGFIEGTSWHYSFMVPYDVPGLIKLNGGNKKFVQKLQSVFDNGLYEPDNEPDMGYAFLFNYVKGEAWRTQKEVRKIVDHYYANAPAGLPGNDDTGTMSAWVVFAMMGIYPDAPAIPQYTICSPYFDRVTIALDPEFYPGKDFQIVAVKASESASRIEKMELNGKPHTSYFLSHQEVVAGGVLKIWLY